MDSQLPTVTEPLEPLHARLEDLTPGARVRGVLPDRAITVVQVEWHGTQALTLTYRDDAGKVDHELLYRANEARLEIEGAGRAWSFNADGALFRLASEALRIRLAHRVGRRSRSR